MVLQKRLDYGFNGYQVPSMPRSTRSARRRGTFKRRREVNQMGRFDLLANVAGKLLLEKESLTTCDKSTGKNHSEIVKKECKEEDKPLKVEPLDQRCYEFENFPFYGPASRDHDQNHCSKQSVVKTSNVSERIGFRKLVNDKTKNEMQGFSGNNASVDYKLNGESKMVVKNELHKNWEVRSDDAVACPNARAPADSGSSGKVTFCRDHVPQSSYPANQEGLKVVVRDDDEKSSGCTHPITSTKPFRQALRIGNRRIRKILASKYWKVAPKYKDDKLSKTDGNLNRIYHNKNSDKRQRSQMNIPFKKRNFFHCSSVSNSDGRMNEGFSDSFEKDVNSDSSATGTSSSIAGNHTSFQSRDSHVKLRIKSFRVPELFIEIPEIATVGSLKRTVMEAVSAILGGGLRVGVILQGKKVRDDNRTLFQTGISLDNQLDSLGFALEPNPSQTPPPLCHGDSPFMLSCDAPEPLTSFVESDHDSTPTPTDASVDKSTTDSKARVAVPAMTMEPLNVVPLHQKSKRSDVVQRRIRRPFSVTEVEALVKAVEKLGTGRWRDVKLRAFDNAKHRTYVDLKDKWKTLVHTARISPQQRRGEPVPQELLDRVLTAHAYWSQQQSKHQLKQQQLENSSLLKAF